MPTLAKKIIEGNVRAASQLMRDLDDQVGTAVAELSELFPRTGRAWIVGVTGSPGAGKSTLVDQLITRYRREKKTVGVVAVDPTSPFTGGAILGDRIRMQAHATDEDVFIRSLATRGNIGGLSRATGDVIRVLDAMGKDVVIVETVGVGQDEVDVAHTAHTVLVVMAPSMGDDVQAIKAGILEIADVFVVNKSDREGADRTARDLRAMLELRPRSQAPQVSWEPPIVQTSATEGRGIEVLAEAIERHKIHLETHGQRAAREQQRTRAELVALLRDRLVGAALDRLEAEEGGLDALVKRIADHRQDPYEVAERLANRLLEDRK
jgi:LAO/AO transport system kinase